MLDEILVLVENRTYDQRVLGEFGFSALVRAGSREFLLDTGLGKALIPNAAGLGVDLSRIEGVVLSHGHNDHTGGLPDLLKAVGARPVYCHPDAFADKRILEKDKPPRRVGLPLSRTELEVLGARFHVGRDPVELAPGVLLSGEVRTRDTYEPPRDNFAVLSDGYPLPDLLLDDQSLYLESEAGLVVLLGCAHAGVGNIVRHALQVTGHTEVYAVLGGMHLNKAPREAIQQVIGELKAAGVRVAAPCHCTGHQAAQLFEAAFGESCIHLSAGQDWRP